MGIFWFQKPKARKIKKMLTCLHPFLSSFLILIVIALFFLLLFYIVKSSKNKASSCSTCFVLFVRYSQVLVLNAYAYKNDNLLIEKPVLHTRVYRRYAYIKV